MLIDFFKDLSRFLEIFFIFCANDEPPEKEG